MNYKKDVKIDKYDLETEWVKQPLLYMNYAEAWAKAIGDRDRAKDRLEITRSELDANIRMRPDEYGFEKKPTEAAISAKIIQQPEYQDAQKELIEANERVNIMAVAKEAMGHKKKALENLTQLMISGYYAEPKIPEKIKEDNNRKVSKQLRKGLKKRMEKNGS